MYTNEFANAFADPRNDALDAERVNVPRRDHGEAAARVAEIALSAHQRRTDAGVDGRVEDEALLVGHVQEGAVVEGGVVGYVAAEDGRVPGVDVAVKMDDGDGAPAGRGRAQGGQGRGVVAAEREDARRRRDGGVGGAAAGEDLVGLVEALEGDAAVEPGEVGVAAVDYRGPVGEGVAASVDAPFGSLALAAGSDTRRAIASAWPACRRLWHGQYRVST